MPPQLQPLWPYVRSGHRYAARLSGYAFRPRSPGGARRLPWTASPTVDQTAAVEPDVVKLVEIDVPATPPRSVPTGEPGDLRFWHDVVHRPTDRAYVLDVAHGRLVGDFAATVTPGGRLELEVSPYWGRVWREHPIFLRPQLPRLERVDGTVLSLASAGSSINYYHSLMDVLPRWGLFRRAFPDLEPDAIAIGHSSRWDQQLQEMLGLDQYPRLVPARGGGIQADRLIVPSLSNRETLAPAWITEWLRDTFLPTVSPVPHRRLYITRGRVPNTRRFVREEELLADLTERGFESFDPGAHSVRDQIETFAGADVVVAPHGAGLVNLNFAPAGVRVLELFAPRYLNPGYWTIVSNIEKSVYRYLVADPVEADRPESKMFGVQSDIDIEPARVLSAVDRLLAE